ncbi:hypothetical protein LTR49_028840, partial [Elasticomyces elasticus]
MVEEQQWVGTPEDDSGLLSARGETTLSVQTSATQATHGQAGEYDRERPDSMVQLIHA